MAGKAQHDRIKHAPLRLGIFPSRFLVMRIILILLLIPLASFLTFAEPSDVPKKGGRESIDHDLGIRVEDGLVFLDVKDADIKEVLKEIGRKAKIDLTVDEGLEGKVTVKIMGATVEQTLKRLCENQAMVFEYDPKNNTYRAVRVRAFLSQKEGMGEGKARVVDMDLESRSRFPAPSTGSSAYGAKKIYDSKGRLLFKPRELLLKLREGATKDRIEVLHLGLLRRP